MDFQTLLSEKGKIVEKVKHEHVFLQGDINRSLYIVQSGLLKAYYTSASGKVAVKSFFLPQDIMGSLTSVYANEYCSYSLVSLETSVLLEIPFATVYEYSLQHHDIANDMIEVLLKFSMKKEKREFEFLCLSAEERYHLLVETSPEILDKVTQSDIARYLGVTPVGLSRIKNRTHGK